MAGSYTSLEVRWWAPAGGPALTGYELRYREHPGGAWTDWPQDGTAAEATITGLKVNTAYEVEVRAVYGEIRSAWVRVPGSVRTGAPAATTIRSVTVVNGPGADGVWSAGERVEVEFRYSRRPHPLRGRDAGRRRARAPGASAGVYASTPASPSAWRAPAPRPSRPPPSTPSPSPPP